MKYLIAILLFPQLGLWWFLTAISVSALIWSFSVLELSYESD